jgi:acyl-CoA dehydrogenase
MEQSHISAEKILSYLQDKLPSVGLSRPSHIIKIEQFQAGQSNPTYLIVCDSGKYVLRKAPHGILLKGAHNVTREARIMQNIKNSNKTCPIPSIYAIEEDEAILGARFFVMEFVEGYIYRNPRLPDQSHTQRRATYYDLATVLATVHNTNLNSVLNLVGSVPEGKTDFCRRQIRIWSQQFTQSSDDIKSLTQMQSLLSWLNANLPNSTDDFALSVVHGDFRLDNIIFGDGGPKAVLDWELAGIGDSNADLAYCCLGYYLPEVGVLSSFALGGRAASSVLPEGIPSMEEFIAVYKAQLGSERGKLVPAITSPEWTFYLCLGLYRIASICAGVYSRALQGNASRGKKALEFKDIVPKLADLGLSLIHSNRLKPTKLHSTRNAVADLQAPVHGEISDTAKLIISKLRSFLDEVVIPLEAKITNHSNSAVGVWPSRGRKWEINPHLDKARAEAQRRGLWNLWMTKHTAEQLMKSHPTWPWDRLLPHSVGLSHIDYAHIAMETGRSLYGADACNCMAPDTGNMEIFAHFGTRQQREQWLLPLLEGRIRSCFGMTEPLVASSDPTQLQATATKTEHGWELNGKKWWTTGACDPRCAVCIVVAVTGGPEDPAHSRHSFLLVPMDQPGVTVVRPLHVFGYDDAPGGHAETQFCSVKIGFDMIIGREGFGFALAQSRLGPGRLHHCCRLLGHCERAMQEVVRRGTQRQAFGKYLLDLGSNSEKLALNRVYVRQAQLAALDAALELDIHDKVVGNEQEHGSKIKSKLSSRAVQALAVCKISCPRAAQQCLDLAIQIHGGGGLSADHPLAQMWAAARTLRLVDGPDEVHLLALSRAEKKKQLSEIKNQGNHPGVGLSRL